jgi:hypothetical protein
MRHTGDKRDKKSNYDGWYMKASLNPTSNGFRPDRWAASLAQLLCKRQSPAENRELYSPEQNEQIQNLPLSDEIVEFD